MGAIKIPPAVIVICIVALVAGIGYVGYHAAVPQQPTGDVTPGVPPWEDPKLKGKVQPGRAPNDWQPSTPAPAPATH